MKNIQNVTSWSRYAFLGGLLLGSVAGVAGQDVMIQGRANGIAPPTWVTERLDQDPGAFEFRRAWKSKVQGIRGTRGVAGASAAPSYTTSNLAAMGAAVTGTLSVPIIPGLYSDVSAPYTQSVYQTRLFGDGAGSVSLSEYYTEISGGAFAMTGQVSDWAVLPNAATYYEPINDDVAERYGRVDEFLRDALLAADGAIDFGLYDNDGPDGIPNSGTMTASSTWPRSSTPQRRRVAGGRGSGHIDGPTSHGGAPPSPPTTASRYRITSSNPVWHASAGASWPAGRSRTKWATP